MPLRLARTIRAHFAAIAAKYSRRHRTARASAARAVEALEVRRLLSAEILSYQFDVEGDTLGLVAQYRSDHRLAADKALAWYSDGGFEQAMQDYDPETNRGQVYLLHPFPTTALPEGQDWSVTFSVQDGAFMDFRTFTAHTAG